MLDPTLSADDDSELSLSATQCQVCYEIVSVEARPCCRGFVCDQCLHRHVKTQLTIRNIHVTCPCVGCNRPVLIDEVRRRLIDDHDLLAKYERWTEVASCRADPHRKTCPRCCWITEVEPSSLSGRTVAKYGLEVRCKDCELEWCFPCHAPGHQGLTCKAFRAADKLLKQWAADTSRGDRNAQQCPKCKVRIHKNNREWLLTL